MIKYILLFYIVVGMALFLWLSTDDPDFPSIRTFLVLVFGWIYIIPKATYRVICRFIKEEK